MNSDWHYPSQHSGFCALEMIESQVSLKAVDTKVTEQWSTACLYLPQVRNIAVSHTFKIEKARRDLGFCPKKYSLTDSVDHYLRTRPPRPTSSLINTQCLLRLLLLLVLGFIVLMLCSAVWEWPPPQTSRPLTSSWQPCLADAVILQYT